MVKKHRMVIVLSRYDRSSRKGRTVTSYRICTKHRPPQPLGRLLTCKSVSGERREASTEEKAVKYF